MNEKSVLNTRSEMDSLGQMRVPAAAYYGAQTARALQNFPISNIRFDRFFIRRAYWHKGSIPLVARGNKGEKHREFQSVYTYGNKTR